VFHCPDVLETRASQLRIKTCSTQSILCRKPLFSKTHPEGQNNEWY
jgi:hypothetical protein